jgi:hypothetical protein
MQALEIEVDITPDGQLLNARLPTSCQSMFGRHTKLIMILPSTQIDSIERQQRIESWRNLLKETQNIAQSQNITETDITAEIAAYRSGS